MEQHKKVVLIVVGLIIVLAFYVIYNTQITSTKLTDDKNQTKQLILKSIDFGTNLTDYSYSFSEEVDGYITTYNLTKRSEQKRIIVLNQLSEKTIYLLNDDSVLCIRYLLKNETCSSIKNISGLTTYLNSLKIKFFDPQLANRNKNDFELLVQKKYLDLEIEGANRNETIININGKKCKQIGYTINFNNATIDDATRFGISANSPKTFKWSICIDESSGLARQKSFNYSSLDGLKHNYRMTVLEFQVLDRNIDPIVVPKNLTKEEAVLDLYLEKQQQTRVVACFFDKRGEEREKCISAIALELQRKELCKLADNRRDRCLVSIVPLTKEDTICNEIKDQDYRDDCFIELAGGNKNASYCALIKNSLKTQTCINIAAKREIFNTSSVSIVNGASNNSKNIAINTTNNSYDPLADAIISEINPRERPV